MAEKFDTIVLGLGGMGSAALYQAASRGEKVLGIEQFTPVHAKGSSHGKSRVLRQAYFEGSMYVPLVLGAYDLWHQLENKIGQKLLTITGGLMIAPQGSKVFAGSQKSAIDYDIAHEVLSSKDVRERYPQFVLPENYLALYENKTGFIAPERAIEAYLAQAREIGAALRFDEKVIDWEATPNFVKITTDKGSYEAEKLIITVGSWTASLLKDLGLPLKVQRRVMHWFHPQSHVDLFSPEKCPISIWEAGQNLFYTFPMQDRKDGIKIAFHTKPQSVEFDEIQTPNDLQTEVDEKEILEMRQCIEKYIPSMNGDYVRSVACMYTMTPDEHFIIDHHPDYKNVAIATGFSGHGFKFASVVGKILSDLVTDGKSQYDINPFSLSRF